MNKNTKNIAIGVLVVIAGYMIWKNWAKKQSSKATNPNEPKKNAIGGGGVVIPKGKKVELLQSAPGVCGYYYQGDDGDLVFVGPAQCPEQA